MSDFGHRTRNVWVPFAIVLVLVAVLAAVG
jgi:hypothetical protein